MPEILIPLVAICRSPPLVVIACPFISLALFPLPRDLMIPAVYKTR